MNIYTLQTKSVLVISTLVPYLARLLLGSPPRSAVERERWNIWRRAGNDTATLLPRWSEFLGSGAWTVCASAIRCVEGDCRCLTVCGPPAHCMLRVYCVLCFSLCHTLVAVGKLWIPMIQKFDDFWRQFRFFFLRIRWARKRISLLCHRSCSSCQPWWYCKRSSSGLSECRSVQSRSGCGPMKSALQRLWWRIRSPVLGLMKCLAGEWAPFVYMSLVFSIHELGKENCFWWCALPPSTSELQYVCLPCPVFVSLSF